MPKPEDCGHIWTNDLKIGFVAAMGTPEAEVQVICSACDSSWVFSNPIEGAVFEFRSNREKLKASGTLLQD